MVERKAKYMTLVMFMTFNEYQISAYSNIKPHENTKDETLDYCLGLAEELGETISIIKHHYYGKEEIDNYKLKKELGDILWYLSSMCSVNHLSLDEIAQLNLIKLNKRYENGFSYERSQQRHQLEI